MIRDMNAEVDDMIRLQNVLISVFDKSKLEKFVPDLIDLNPDVMFYSTGGTLKKLKEIIGNQSKQYVVEISEYTGFPEMEGGLVKTLHPKIHAGLLGERNNKEHQNYLTETLGGGVFFDLAVVNLYPFQNVVKEENTTFEQARGNIDIGGPTMIRAAAKNFPSVAVACQEGHYDFIIKEASNNNGCIDFGSRFRLARAAFSLISDYDKAIDHYFWNAATINLSDVKSCYNIKSGDLND